MRRHLPYIAVTTRQMISSDVMMEVNHTFLFLKYCFVRAKMRPLTQMLSYHYLFQLPIKASANQLQFALPNWLKGCEYHATFVQIKHMCSLKRLCCKLSQKHVFTFIINSYPLILNWYCNNILHVTIENTRRQANGAHRTS